MKSAIYCEHANESPRYARYEGVLICACPDDCYCKHEGGCKELRARASSPFTVSRDGRVVASCTSTAAALAAGRLMDL